MEIEDDSLFHYGMPRRSGRYPWGSGEDPYQNSKNFLSYVDDLKKQGLSDVEIAQGLGMSTTQLRQDRSIHKNQVRAADEAQAVRLKDKGYSNVAIGARMNIPESTVRAHLSRATKGEKDILTTTSNLIRDNVKQHGLVDVGEGVQRHIGVSKQRMDTAVAMLQKEGYKIHYIKQQQLGTGNETTYKVLAPGDLTYREVYDRRGDIMPINGFSEDHGRSFLGLHEPKVVSSDRVQVKYADDGGAEADGLIYIRPGVEDLSMGGASYAQVRISVDGTHYLKGMAIPKDGLPKGVDVVFNTNKDRTSNKKDAMKPMKDDPDNPFGSVVRQIVRKDANGKEEVVSALNIVNEEGDWDDWSKNLSSQMLSKQTTALAQQQLDKAYQSKKSEFDEIMSLTNPVVQKKLLESFADNADASAVSLKAAALPRQNNRVIIPVNTLKDNEIYAFSYRDGERVALVRHPHGGTFEIPELVVNNRHPDAKALLGNAKDAVGINSNVAARLSGADFDGDAVLVIPNDSGAVRTSPSLKGLEGFDPQRSYPGYEGMKPMSSHTTQMEMGKVSNLITDMTIKGATQSEIARAVRHSMVVIDAEKHKLNYKQSAVDNGIAQLKEKYQREGDSTGASTIVSRASSELRIPDRIVRRARDGGPVDPKTGRRMYTETGESYVNAKGETVTRTTKSTRMAETDDARTLMSTNAKPIEQAYATHANRMKSLGNQARKAALEARPIEYSSSARTTYQAEVETLKGKLNTALMNAPLERRAQTLGNAVVEAKRRANPNMDNAELKKLKGMALNEARSRVGAGKIHVDITPKEWEAIQSGAVSTKFLSDILNNTDLDKIKELATPRTIRGLTPSMASRAKAMLANGHTQAEVADALGVSTSTIAEL